MNYTEAIQFLYDRLPMYQRVGDSAFKKGLDNVIALCRELGDPHKSFRSVHIGGTNGKGSSAHMLAAILQSAGYKTGLYTSPHLKSFTERIKLNGEEIGEQEVVQFVRQSKELICRIEPSFFEITVAMAFDFFAKEKVDVAVIEVGLGGRLDSTNIINPLASLITNVSLDHVQFLGDSIESIAKEKAGIIKTGVPAIIGESQAQSDHIFEKAATNLGLAVTFADRQWIQNDDCLSFHNVKTKETVEIPSEEYVPGYQKRNIRGVLSTVEVLKGTFHLTRGNVIHGLKNFKSITGLRGRWDVLEKIPLTICDTAHNEAGIKEIVNELRKTNNNGRLHIIWGMVNEKDTAHLVSLLPEAACYYFCQPNIPRALDVEELHEAAAKAGRPGATCKSVSEAIRRAKEEATSEDLIFIGGSTFVVAEALEFEQPAVIRQNNGQKQDTEICRQ